MRRPSENKYSLLGTQEQSILTTGDILVNQPLGTVYACVSNVSALNAIHSYKWFKALEVGPHSLVGWLKFLHVTNGLCSCHHRDFWNLTLVTDTWCCSTPLRTSCPVPEQENDFCYPPLNSNVFVEALEWASQLQNQAAELSSSKTGQNSQLGQNTYHNNSNKSTKTHNWLCSMIKYQ